MSEVQWAVLTGFILGAFVGAGVMSIVNLRWTRGIMVDALAKEALERDAAE